MMQKKSWLFYSPIFSLGITLVIVRTEDGLLINFTFRYSTMEDGLTIERYK